MKTTKDTRTAAASSTAFLMTALNSSRSASFQKAYVQQLASAPENRHAFDLHDPVRQRNRQGPFQYQLSTPFYADKCHPKYKTPTCFLSQHYNASLLVYRYTSPSQFNTFLNASRTMLISSSRISQCVTIRQVVGPIGFTLIANLRISATISSEVLSKYAKSACTMLV